MNDKIKHALDQVHAEQTLKNKTNEFLHQKINKSRRRSITFHSRKLYVAIGCLFFVVFAGIWFYVTPTVEISIDINPSLELGINRLNQIVSVRAYNEDGQQMADELDLKYKNYTEAVNQILSAETVQSLLSKDEWMTICIVGSENDHSLTILQNLKSCIREEPNASCYFANKDTVNQAHQFGLSYGKYLAYLQLSALDPTLTPQDVQKMTMKEIKTIMEQLENTDNVSDTNTNHENQNGYHKQENQFGNGTGNKFGKET